MKIIKIVKIIIFLLKHLVQLFLLYLHLLLEFYLGVICKTKKLILNSYKNLYKIKKLKNQAVL